MGDNEGPTAVMYTSCLRESKVFYDSDVKTGNIENKTIQTMECADIILLFLFIKELVYLQISKLDRIIWKDSVV